MWGEREEVVGGEGEGFRGESPSRRFKVRLLLCKGTGSGTQGPGDFRTGPYHPIHHFHRISKVQ